MKKINRDRDVLSKVVPVCILPSELDEHIRGNIAAGFTEDEANTAVVRFATDKMEDVNEAHLRTSP